MGKCTEYRVAEDAHNPGRCAIQLWQDGRFEMTIYRNLGKTEAYDVAQHLDSQAKEVQDGEQHSSSERSL